MAGINRKSIVAEERLLESTVAAKRSTVELTKSILHLTSKIIAQVPKEKFDLILENSVYASPNIDITQKVIKALNDQK